MTQPESPPEEGEFRRVHPLSPFVRGGLIVLGVLGYVVSQEVDRLTGAAPPGGPPQGEGPFSLLVQAGAVGAVVLGAIGLGLLTWWFTRYRLGGDSLEIRTGAIFRQHRQVRYDRIQAVDLVRPLLARLTGLSEVRVESAGGGDSHISIAYLRRAEAEAVRSRLLGLAARTQQAQAPGPAGGPGPAPGHVGAAHEPDGPAPGPGGQQAAATVPLLRVPVERLVGSVLLSGDTIFFGTFLLLAGALTVADLGVVIGGFLPFVLVTGGRSLLRLTRWYGAAVGLRGQTVTVQRGLTDTRSSSVPLHRVQAVEIRQPLLWRRPGWWVLKVNVAGANFGSADSGGSEDVLVPVATTAEVLSLVQVVVGDRGTCAELAELVESTPARFLGQPTVARWLDPLAHRRIGCLLGARALLTRGGWLGRWLQVVPYGRIQSITVRQGPLERWLDLADVRPISTVGPVSPRVSHLARADAERLGAVAAELAGRARRAGSGRVGCDPAPDRVDWSR